MMPSSGLTGRQIFTLEKTFECQKYLTAAERSTLAGRLQVQIPWYNSTYVQVRQLRGFQSTLAGRLQVDIYTGKYI